MERESHNEAPKNVLVDPKLFGGQTAEALSVEEARGEARIDLVEKKLFLEQKIRDYRAAGQTDLADTAAKALLVVAEQLNELADLN